MRLACFAVVPLVMTVACGGTSLRYAELDAVTLVRPLGQQLVISGWHGACDRVLEPEVVEADTEVRLRMPLLGGAGDCTAVGVSLTTTSTLERPLGDRSVINAATKERLRVD